MFGLQTYDTHIIYKKEDQDDWAASVRYEEDYQRIMIFIYPCFFVDNTPADQRLYLLHEFCHFLMAELAAHCRSLTNGNLVTPNQISLAVERSTSRSANIIESLLLGRESDATKAYRTLRCARSKKTKKK